MVDKIIIATGWFDPIHSGHVEYFQEAALYGKLIVWANSDEWLIKKKGKYFMDWNERKKILEEFNSVWMVIAFDDDKAGTACWAIHKVTKMFPDSEILFANGGDRVAGGDSQVSAEEVLCKELWIEVIYGVGKSGKIQSSSDLLKRWKEEE